MSTLGARHRHELARLLETDFAHDRLAAALFEVLADGLDLGPCAVLTAADRTWVRDAISGAIQRTAADAVERLVSDLASSFATGPAALVERMVGCRDGATMAVDAPLVGLSERAPVAIGA
jgi:hypothetical protein